MTRLGAGLQPRYVWLRFHSTSQGFDMALLAIIHAAIAGFMLFFTAVVPQAGHEQPAETLILTIHDPCRL